MLMRLLMTAALIGGAAIPAPAADTELRFSSWVPAQHPLQPRGWEPWGESMKAASNGRISLTIYPAQQLGAAPDHYDMARDGIADMAYINPGYQAGRFPVVALAELPFLISNAKGGTRAFDAWYRQYADREMQDVHFCMAYLHSPGTFHSKAKIADPGDVRGKNVRPAHATMGRFITLLGGANVQVSAPEAREVLSKGAADAITFPWNSIYLFGIDGVTKNHLDMPLYVSTFVTVMNQSTYDGLSTEDRQVIDDHCTSDWAEKVATGWADWEDEGRTKMLNAPDHEVYKPTAEEVAAWRKASAPLLDAWKKDVAARGYDADAVAADLKAKLKEAGALYE
jgi:TRAP-type C4-dicarboxylate transport system substrate-binding protein